MNPFACNVLIAITLVSLCGSSSAQVRGIPLRDAAQDAANEIAALKTDLRGVSPKAVKSASYLEEQLRLLSSLDSGEIDWGERAQRHIAKIVGEFDRMRVNAERSGTALPDTTALEESIRVVFAAVRAEAQAKRRIE